MTTTKTLVIVRHSKGVSLGYYNTTDGTEAEVKLMDTPGQTGDSIGKALNGAVINEIEVFCATPSDLDKVCIYNESAGIVWEAEGNITAALFPAPNLAAYGLQIPVKTGYTLKVLTSD